jgi:hypothetical protein
LAASPWDWNRRIRSKPDPLKRPRVRGVDLKPLHGLADVSITMGALARFVTLGE